MTPQQKLQTLREAMHRAGLDGFVVPRMDKYQGEFIGENAERLRWLTGFTGSAGIAVVLRERAAVLTDGRYTIQLPQQIDTRLYECVDGTKTPSARWIADNASGGAVIGYDPWLHTPRQIEAMEKILSEKKIVLRAVEENPIASGEDEAGGEIEIFPDAVAGATLAEKKTSIVDALKQKNVLATVLNLPDSLMWLMNVRGGDMDTTPVILSLGILYADERPLQWFVDPGQITAKVRQHLQDQVTVYPPDGIVAQIDVLGAESKKTGRSVALDFGRTPLWFKHRLEAAGAGIIDLKDPCIDRKAIKSPQEKSAIRQAHIRDGAAMVKFLAWLAVAGPEGGQSEISVAEKLEGCRRLDPAYKGPSFPTIAGFGPNGAIVHYRAEDATNRYITAPGLLLLDSGGQYHYGTTDITRTVAIGAPSTEMKRHFTTVLKGHIALAHAHFPEGTTGAQIDALVRAPLWQAGMDYAHGTGHGVGCYLAVHEEAAAGISPRGHEVLKPGMLLSNEPGYYREGHYGIRIENLVFVTQLDNLLGFETVTLCPIDRHLIVRADLSPEELAWVNDYHVRVQDILMPHLNEPHVKDWLAAACVPL